MVQNKIAYNIEELSLNHTGATVHVGKLGQVVTLGNSEGLFSCAIYYVSVHTGQKAWSGSNRIGM